MKLRYIILAIVLYLLLFSPEASKAQVSYELPAPTPAIYQQWYEEILNCTGVVHPKLKYADLHFRFTTDSSFSARGQKGFIAYTYVSDSTIVLTQWNLFAEQTLKHEFIHAITGSPNHGQMFGLCGVYMYWRADSARAWPTNGIEEDGED